MKAEKEFPAVMLTASDADTIRQFIEEHQQQFEHWCETNTVYADGEVEERVAELLDKLEGK